VQRAGLCWALSLALLAITSAGQAIEFGEGAVLLFALAFVIINLLVDLSYGLLDPRVGQQG